MAMSRRIYYEYSMACDARSIALMSVKTCSKAILAPIAGHGKSPCFSRRSFLAVVGADGALLVFALVDVEAFLECALWHGNK